MRKGIVLLAVLGITLLAAACQPAAGRAITVTGAWARPGFVGGVSAVYLKIDNPGSTADVLLSAESSVAQMVQLHMTSMGEGGTMSMQEQERVDIPAGTLVEFRPGGLHVMLINLQQELNPEDTFQITLMFENAGQMKLDVPVRAP